MASDEFAPPKYAQIVQAIRRKIADGTYPRGRSSRQETQFVREFGVAGRPSSGRCKPSNFGAPSTASTARLLRESGFTGLG